MFLDDGMLKYKNKTAIVCVAPTSLREALMSSTHNQGHFGPEKVL